MNLRQLQIKKTLNNFVNIRTGLEKISTKIYEFVRERPKCVKIKTPCISRVLEKHSKPLCKIIYFVILEFIVKHHSLNSIKVYYWWASEIRFIH